MMKNLTITLQCPFCGDYHKVSMNETTYYNWCSGELIQNAMPDMTPTEREQLISGLCPNCQEKIFGN